MSATFDSLPAESQRAFTAVRTTWAIVRVYGHNRASGDGTLVVQGPFDRSFGMQLRTPRISSRSRFIAFASNGLELQDVGGGLSELIVRLESNNPYVNSDEFFVTLKMTDPDASLDVRNSNVAYGIDFESSESLSGWVAADGDAA